MVFVDTSFLIASLNPRDSHHADALALQDVLAGGDLITTNHVVGESWTFAGRRFGRHIALRLVDALQSGSRYTLIHVAAETEHRAWAWLRRHDEREYSFVDATSFETMREQGIDAALAFDADFHAAGFQTVRA